MWAAFDPYNCSKGRWLDKNSKRRAERHLSFDFQALLDIAIASCPGARNVVACEKKEGGFNRVFSIQLDNGRNVVARIPTRAVKHAGLAVSSEVATLQFGESNCHWTSLVGHRLTDRSQSEA
jgi:hypothetical protein